jgi:uncharacterized protein YndB with AHSA1/START domain
MKKNQLVYVTFIRTTPKKLWDAITKPEFARQYWAGHENISDWKKGSKWQHVMKGKERRCQDYRRSVGMQATQAPCFDLDRPRRSV